MELLRWLTLCAVIFTYTIIPFIILGSLSGLCWALCTLWGVSKGAGQVLTGTGKSVASLFAGVFVHKDRKDVVD
jgi:hypothetical protein